MKKRGFATTAVHTGYVDPSRWPSRPATTPIYQTVVFDLPDLEVVDQVMDRRSEGYVYTRFGNPNTASLEEVVAALEGAERALGCSSGMGAITAVLLSGLSAGDHIISAYDIYGGTMDLMREELGRLGVRTSFVDVSNPDEVESAVTPNTKLIYAETISNPLLRVADLEMLAEVARSAGAELVVDNTFATPYILRPLEWGASVVIHSATKFISGHADVMGGVAAGEAQRIEQARRTSINLGMTLDPFAAWLACRGLKTLKLRVAEQCRNAMGVAEYLQRHPMVLEVHYPGLETHPQHKLAKKQFQGGYGALVSFEVKGGLDGAEAFIKGTELIRFTPSPGDVSTTMAHPAKTSHRAQTAADRERYGIRPGLIRLSVGIEDLDDLLADLEQGLAAVARLR